ncbi:MAG: hypothetical protein ACREKF_11655, partial [Candidatus Methylomirabilales bacterium]
MRGGAEGILPPFDARLDPLRLAQDHLDLLLGDTPLDYPTPRMPVKPDGFIYDCTGTRRYRQRSGRAPVKVLVMALSQVRR